MLDEAPNVNVVESISLHAKFKGNRTALICGELRLNWTDFNCPSQHHRQHTHKSSTLINPAHS